MHIGTEKTGSTALQVALANNRAALESRGVFYPGETDGAHHDLVNCVAVPRLATRVMGATEKSEYITRLAAEVASYPSDAVAVISSELCHSRLKTASRAGAMLNIIRAIGLHPWRIVVYLRDQCSLLESAYAEGIKGGLVGTVDDHLSKDRPYFSHDTVIRRWEEAAGRLPQAATIEVHSYNRHRTDIPGHFVHRVLGLPGLELAEEARENARASRAVIDTVRRAKTIDPGIDSNALHLLLSGVDPRPVRPFLDPESRSRVRQEFQAENLAVCRRFGLDPLDFPPCAAHEEPDLEPLGADDLIRMILALAQRTDA